MRPFASAITFAFAITFAATLLGAPARAQDIDDVSRRTQVLQSFELPAIVEILDELRIVHRERSNGRFINVTFTGGTRATIGRSACRGRTPRCKGLTISARFGRGKPRWKPLDKLKKVDSFNYKHSFIKAGLDESGQFYLSRYELNDFGVTRGSIATSLLVFANLSDRFAKHLKAD